MSPGYAIITKKNGNTYIKEILEPKEKKRAHSKEYIFRGGDSEIYQERKNLGKALFPQVYNSIKEIEKSVFLLYRIQLRHPFMV